MSSSAQKPRPAAKKGLKFTFKILLGHAALHRILAVGTDEIIGRAQVVSATGLDTCGVQIGNKTDNFQKVNLHATTVTLGGDIGDVVELVVYNPPSLS